MGMFRKLRRRIALKIYPEFERELGRLRTKIEYKTEVANALAKSRDYYKRLIDEDPNYVRPDELREFDKFDEFMRNPDATLIFD